MEKKRRFNIIDVIVLVLILAVVGFLGYKVMNNIQSRGADTITLKYQVLYEGVSNDLYDAAAAHVPSQIMASGVLYDSYVTAVEKEPYYIYADGQWVEDPYHCNLIFTVEGNVANASVLTTEVGSQEVRVGKEHVLKTQYLEFDKGVITFVEWGKAD
ncbi:MAG: DUF4330 domain-containing protein [Oscillospiraceae bacterium]